YDEVRRNPDVQPAELAQGYYVRYVQCHQVPDQQSRTTLEAAGLRIYGYVPFGTYLVGIPQGFDLDRLGALKVRSIVAVQPDWKLARTLRERPFGDWAVHGDEVDVNVQLYPHVSIAQGAEMCRALGLVVLKEGTQNGFLQLRLPQANLSMLAAQAFVRHLELVPPPAQKEDINGRSIHRANVLDADSPLGKKYNGEGVNTLVRDDGQLGPHIDLQGRLDNSLAEGEPTAGTHGDGVGGIIGGAGNLDPTKKGMAAGAKLYVLDYESDFQDETLPLHLDQHVTITNSSYSNGCNVGYTLASQTVDQQIFEHPTLMHVFSAGNSNNLDCGYGAGDQWGNITGGHKMAKNSIATANLNADMTLNTTSSRGPAHDGRLKPDISAHGAGQNSLNPNNGYQEFGGTSAAAPGIAGCLAQLTHAFKTINSAEPPSALLKASILNTANDLGQPGPDFQFGWGHINSWRALRTFELNRWRTDSVTQGAEKTHTVQIPNLTRNARLMVVWADVPAEESASRALVNDLDITVTSSTGTVYQPWKLDPTPDPLILDTPAGKGRDSLNNMEQVSIDNPASGTYTVRVKGTEVPFGPQRYYLVWDFQNDDVKITYPNGGEGFIPGTKERIHWDAYGTANPFTLRYSTDGGNTFNAMATLTGEKRTYDWTVPNTVSGQVRFLLLRNPRRDTSDFNSTISPIPGGLRVEKVCPDSMTIGWDLVNDTLGHKAGD
ncbi:MAG TPA: S8 family serine peptidase, partial [Saprospiraceae bacterium]|nr:S8 family serine peptidase [Saprospiraceae bacterium]